MTNPGRRAVLGAALTATAAAATTTPASAVSPSSLRTAGRGRLTLPSGIQTGDVDTRSAVLWARSSGVGRMHARIGRQVVRGPWVGPDTDLTGKLVLPGLRPGVEYAADIWFEDERGREGERATAHFRTGSSGRAATSFVWTGDTAGQGWGINPDLGGMTAYRTMLETRPDFFVHAGDTVYSDGPISETVTEPDGQVWRNVVTPEVSVVAQDLDQFRGRHRYNRMDENVRAFSADVPVLAQWDDHETCNNWYPGEILDDERYTERRVDVLAARARRAWQEYMPITPGHVSGRGRSGFAEGRIYRKVSRGAHLDVFCLDMRTSKDPNTPGLEPDLRHILGPEQTEWLIREVTRSRATWKVISADLPLGIVVPDGAAQESLSNADPGKPLGKELEIARVLAAFKRHRVRNVVWVTADVHYCAAHHYSPERAAFTDFDPFWEFVAGPINAGTFGPNAMDATFGPEVVFSKAADYPNQSPRGGNQFFGHVAIDASGLFTASLRNTAGEVLFSRDLEPQRR
ncbi:alkaline phosphatase D family protein [Phycicoccus sp. CSK15P-2]|uniref:alkaline phosphatase D family protein n=1 Tax=Phycicoccus sp. CSK15P-2 TaxID=2807627 RepID=UPI001952078D|nr:alkaline phosphatase D family protein [Phycicoccus sp. CSK15P-2]MBM6405854.1 alkaline phosphatase D family protein [Phycicoccus sp. CSK15P-2]